MLYQLEKPSTVHKKVVRFQDKAAKVLIWTAAGFTMSMLALIVGFIVVNGLYTRDERARRMLPSAAETVNLPGGGSELQVYVSGDLNVDTLEYGQLRDIFSGTNGYWGYISDQNRRITPVLYDAPDFTAELGEYLFWGEGEFPSKVARIRDPKVLATLVKNNDGVILCYPGEPLAGGHKKALSKLKKVKIQYLMLAVHPGVTELQNGRRLESLSWEAGEVQSVLAGDFADWSALGGPEGTEIKPVGYAPDTEEASYYKHLGVRTPSFFASAADEEDAVRILDETAGGIAVVSERTVLKSGLTTLDVESVRRSWNLSLPFILESPSRAGAVGGISYIILNTLVMVLFVLFIATPVGVAGAVYLSEYAGNGIIVQILRIGIDTLAGIPSIIFGLFGYVFFAGFLGLKTGLLSGTFTLTIMILPTLIRTSEEAIRSVPDDLKSGSLAVGATWHQTIWQIVLPAASPGILTGIILGLGRAIGESAALLFTMGSNLALIKSLNSPMRVLSIHLYMLIRENISLPKAFATATILVIIVFFVNYVTKKLIGGMGYRKG